MKNDVASWITVLGCCSMPVWQTIIGVQQTILGKPGVTKAEKRRPCCCQSVLNQDLSTQAIIILSFLADIMCNRRVFCKERVDLFSSRMAVV